MQQNQANWKKGEMVLPGLQAKKGKACDSGQMDFPTAVTLCRKIYIAHIIEPCTIKE